MNLSSICAVLCATMKSSYQDTGPWGDNMDTHQSQENQDTQSGGHGPDADHLKALRKPSAGDVPLSHFLDPLTREGELYTRLPDGGVQCYACAHRCVIKPGGRGICQVRYNLDGTLYVPWGYVSGLQSDPIEKKPFNHVYPGSDTLTFGMLGCDMHCSYCQNWDISQALRDADAGRPPEQVEPQVVAQLATRYGAKSITSSYNEPLITSEWAVAIFKEAQTLGLSCQYVSNGNASREVLEYIRPYVAAIKIDLKSMDDQHYRELGAVLDNVLDGVRMAHEMGFWVEIVTLVVPGLNDSVDELRAAAQFIRSVSADIPWHVTAFHKDYRMHDPDNTDVRTLIHAAEIGYAEGLHYVYAGNVPGRVESHEHTYCPKCRATLIKRLGYVVLDYQITPEGTCSQCGTAIAGLWPKSRQDVRIGTIADLFSRAPRRVR
ncbi:MAG: AmmeMemoRadiSam system radical SAM enzyme [Anaerolineae bacterium]|nr:AmmeMemoRadiSam system radical SAM enzyme [Anaerolineae bacterium]